MLHKLNIVKAKKERGAHDIESVLREPEASQWMNQIINFEQFKQEVIETGREYIKNILSPNKENVIVDKIKQEFDEIS